MGIIEGAIGRKVKEGYIAGGAPGAFTVAGIKKGDRLISVFQEVGAGVAITDRADRTSEFSITADDTINNTGGTDTTGSKLTVLWNAQE